MHIEAKMNVLEKDLHEKVNAGKNKTINMAKGNNSSMMNLGHSNSSYNNNSGVNNNNNNSAVNNNSRSSTLLKRTKTFHNPFKSSML